jgi:uncharacterized protein with HEPN domain
MLPLEIRKYLYDIQQACELLNDFTAGKTLTDYAANAMLRAAVERQFEIIGEALNQMLKREPALAPRLSDHRRIIAFRNRLIHGYADIDDEVVWGVLTTSLPRLRREIVALLPDPTLTPARYI